MIRLILSLCLLVPLPGFAASDEDLASLHRLLKTDALMQILSEEGLAQSDALQDDMFPDRGGRGWQAVVGTIYATDKLSATFRDAFNDALADTDVQGLLEFYRSETGARIATLEVDARRAIVSDDVEEAARQAFTELADAGSPRLALLEEFASLNNLIDRNVTGALNANLAFFQGLGTSENFAMTEDQMLTDVWSREAEIRDDTHGWIFGFLTFALEPLSDAQVGAYVDLAATDAGQDLNRALFAGFDALFQDVSYDLGAAAGRFSVGNEL